MAPATVNLARFMCGVMARPQGLGSADVAHNTTE
jgi:hypothetical protein